MTVVVPHTHTLVDMLATVANMIVLIAETIANIIVMSVMCVNRAHLKFFCEGSASNRISIFFVRVVRAI